MFFLVINKLLNQSLGSYPDFLYPFNTNNNETKYLDGVYVVISLASAKQELEYLKNDLKN